MNQVGIEMTAHWLSTILLVFFPAFMAYSATSDLLTMTIPNRLCAALAVGYLLFAAVLGTPAMSFGVNLACGLGVLALTFTLFQLGWIGGGDAKLAAATALWIGWDPLLNYGLYASLLGGALTLAILALRLAPLPNLLMQMNWLARLAHPRTGIPYGIALAGAGLLVYPDTQIWRAISGI